MIELNILKDGKRHAVTMSFDDGDRRDERLVSIFNEYGIRGTFHLNSGRYQGEHPPVRPEELSSLYAGHEIACHGVRHASMSYLDPTAILHEIMADRIFLEKYAGYPVRGLSYANGKYTESCFSPLSACGIVYSRTTCDTGDFKFPENFLAWHPTTHQAKSVEYAKNFLSAISGYYSGPKLLYIWGHSHEFERMVSWAQMEECCKILSGDDRIWYATNIEIHDYLKAQSALILSADHKMVFNPSAQRIWFTCDGEVTSVAPGEMWRA